MMLRCVDAECHRDGRVTEKGEDLAANAGEQIVEIVARTDGGLGVDPCGSRSRQMLLRAVHNSSFRTMRIQEETDGSREAFFRRGKAAGWKEEPSETHDDQTKRFGYPSEGS